MALADGVDDIGVAVPRCNGVPDRDTSPLPPRIDLNDIWSGDGNAVPTFNDDIPPEMLPLSRSVPNMSSSDRCKGMVADGPIPMPGKPDLPSPCACAPSPPC